MKALLVIALVTGTAHADVDVTADQAVALFRDKNPRLAANRSAIDVVAADLVDAQIYPNPTVSVGTLNILQGQDTFGHSQESLGLDIPVLIGGQRGHRERAAHARIAAKRADVELDQAKAELEIRKKFAALLAAQEKVTTLAAAVDDAKAVRVIVAGRQQAGAKSPYELERTDLAVAALASKLDEANTDRAGAAGELAVAVGIPDWQPHAVGAFAAPPRVTDPRGPTDRSGPSEPAAAVAADHPELAADAAAEAAARSEESLAHSEAVPTPSLNVQGFTTTDPEGIALMIGITLPLPLFDRNQGAVARAKAQQREADLAHKATTSELSADLARAVAQFRARRAAVATFETDAIERLPRVRQMAEASYKAGQGGIVELLDALDAITEARLRHIELIEAALDAELDVRAASRGR